MKWWARLYGMRSVVIWLRSAVIWHEESSYMSRSAVIWKGARLHDAMILMATTSAGARTPLGPNSSADPQVAIPIKAWDWRKWTKSWRQKVTPLERLCECPCLDPSSHPRSLLEINHACYIWLRSAVIWHEESGYMSRSADIWQGARLHDAMILMATTSAGARTLLGPNSSADPQVAILIKAWDWRKLTKSWRQKVTPLERLRERPCLDPSSHPRSLLEINHACYLKKKMYLAIYTVTMWKDIVIIHYQYPHSRQSPAHRMLPINHKIGYQK
jgi:hypothetical protein